MRNNTRRDRTHLPEISFPPALLHWRTDPSSLSSRLCLTGVRTKPNIRTDMSGQVLRRLNGNLHPVAGAVFFIFREYLPPALGSPLACGSSAVILSAPLHAPVKDIIILVSLADEEISEELAKVRIVRLVIETESACVVEENAELIGEAAAEEISGSGHLLFHDAVILLLLGSCLQALPGKRAAKEVHENVSERLQVVTTGLLDAQMRVDGCVASRAGQVLVLPVGDVQVRLRV